MLAYIRIYHADHQVVSETTEAVKALVPSIEDKVTTGVPKCKQHTDCRACHMMSHNIIIIVYVLCDSGGSRRTKKKGKKQGKKQGR